MKVSLNSVTVGGMEVNMTVAVFLWDSVCDKRGREISSELFVRQAIVCWIFANLLVWLSFMCFRILQFLLRTMVSR